MNLAEVPLLAQLTPELVWGLFPRGLGIVYILACGAMIPQVIEISGSDGAAPLAPRLAVMKRDYPGLRRFFDVPTVFWLSQSHAMLIAVPVLGVLCGVWAILGGPYSWIAHLLAWVVLLSMDVVVNMVFPWDCLILEASFFAMFLPSTPLLPELALAEAPPPLMRFMWQLLTIRLMWGFAKQKFIGSDHTDRMYLRGFLCWAPLPTRVGWIAQHGPKWFLWAAYFGMFAAEVFAPAAAFFPGAPRLVGYVMLVGLMLGIQATGSWGYFNIGYIILCTCLLDLDISFLSLFQGPLSAWWATPSLAFANGVMVFWFLMSLLHFPLNNWVNQVWVHWPMDDVTWKRPGVKAFLGFLRFLQPFRIVAGYGVFPPKSIAPIKIIPIVEGSDDGETWKAFPYKHLPTFADSPPRWVAPYHPRMDQAITYAATGMNDANLLSSLIGAAYPHSYSHHYLMDCLMQRLLEGSPAVQGMFGENPFPNAPPKWVRASTYAFTPTTLEERKRTGDWWHRRYCGPHLPATQKDPLVWKHFMAEPERFHPDHVGWRRRAPALQAIVAAWRGGMDPAEACVVQSDIDPTEVGVFWDEVVPRLQQQRGDWERISELVAELEQTYGRARMHGFERILERLAYLVRQALEPHFYGDTAPKIELKNNLFFHLLCHEVVLDGREATLEMLANPALGAERATRVTEASALFSIGVFRHQMLLFQTRCIRYIDCMSASAAEPDVGAFSFWPFLRGVLHDPDEWLPDVQQQPDGEWSIRGFGET